MLSSPPLSLLRHGLILVLATVLLGGIAFSPAYADPTPSASQHAVAGGNSGADSELDLILEQLKRLLGRLNGRTRGVTAPSSTGGARTPGLGPTRSGLAWHSGAWVGGRFTPAGIDAFGEMRGRPVDLVTTYGNTETPEKLSGDAWPITTWEGFGGRLNYGLPLAFQAGPGLDGVAAGAADQHYRSVARTLVQHGRGDSVVRAGWEFNYQPWPWGTSADNVDSFKKAFRHVVTVMRAEAPQLRFEFGISCHDGLAGDPDRLAPLTRGYPGDDVVDIVGCDTYDRWSAHAADSVGWQNVLRGQQGPGIQDVVDFARQHKKFAGFGEWGLAKSDGKNNGGGDNPFYVASMFRFFAQNADVLAFECYFDEPDPQLESSLVLQQMPRSRQAYARLWAR